MQSSDNELEAQHQSITLEQDVDPIATYLMELHSETLNLVTNEENQDSIPGNTLRISNEANKSLENFRRIQDISSYPHTSTNISKVEELQSLLSHWELEHLLDHLIGMLCFILLINPK